MYNATLVFGQQLMMKLKTNAIIVRLGLYTGAMYIQTNVSSS